LRISNEMVFFTDLKPNRILRKEHNCNSISKEQIRHFSTQHTQYKFQEETLLITAPNSSKSKFPMDVLNQPLELMVQHEQFQFQLIESCKGVQEK
jgi:hypothetical protein